MKKTLAAGMALALGCMACAGPKVTELDAQIAMMQAETARACYAAVATFSIATSERWKGQDGKVQESTEWHRIVAWGKLAEICGQYLRKGSRIYIEGKLQTRKWQDRDGSDRYITEIVAREMKMLDTRNAAPSTQQNNQGQAFNPQPQRMVPEQPVPF